VKTFFLPFVSVDASATASVSSVLSDVAEGEGVSVPLQPVSQTPSMMLRIKIMPPLPKVVAIKKSRDFYFTIVSFSLSYFSHN
jgi:hypothetical protein